MSETKTVAVIGAAEWGSFMLQPWRRSPASNWQQWCDVVPDTAQLMADTYGTKLATDPASTASAGYDGVVVASPDNTHAELTLLALEAGSRVLCEKPLSDTVATAQAVVDAEAALGERRVQLGFMREYDAAHIGLANELANLGSLQYLRCTHRNTNEVARPSAMVLVQSLVHDIHTVHWLGGPVLSVDARVIERPGGLDHVLLVLRLASGATATVEFSDNTYAYEVEVEATTSSAMVTTSAPQRPRLRVDGDHRTPIGADWFGLVC